MKNMLNIIGAFIVAAFLLNPMALAAGESNFTNIVLSEDLKFRTNLIAEGRYGNDVTTLLSSSTPIGTTQLAYAVIKKEVGGSGGLDETDGGTRLDDGTPGQTLRLIVTFLETGGTWVVTPDTKTGYSTLTFDAVGEYATLVYLNDTVGWVIDATNAAVA